MNTAWDLSALPLPLVVALGSSRTFSPAIQNVCLEPLMTVRSLASQKPFPPPSRTCFVKVRKQQDVLWPKCSIARVRTLLLGVVVLCSSNAYAATQTVTNLNDSGTGSFRQALTSAVSGDTVVFAPGVQGTITLASIINASGKSLNIQGPGAQLLTVSGNKVSAILTMPVNISGLNKTVNISGLTFANGGTGGGGGGIAISSATAFLNIDRCVFLNNVGTTFGVIYSASNNPVTITNSTFAGNSAAAIVQASHALTVTNSTFVHNIGTSGAAVYLGAATASAVISDSTFVANSGGVNAAGAIGIFSGVQATVNNSLFAYNTGPAGGGGAISTKGAPINASNNVYWQNTDASGAEGDCFGCTTNTNAINADTKLVILANYGGPTPTVLPLPESPAICAASSSLVASGVTQDQRGFPLVSACVDAGAVQTNYLLASTTADTNNGACTTSLCSLRDAMTKANTDTMEDIAFQPGVSGTMTATSPLPQITSQTNIVGPSTGGMTISGSNSSAVGTLFSVAPAAELSLVRLTVSNGQTSGNGGAVDNQGEATIVGSTLSANSALQGGGIYNVGSLLVANSTFFGNMAPGTVGSGSGGAIFNQGIAQVESSTVTGNTAGAGGGIFNDTNGAITVANSLLAGNTEAVSPGDDCSSCGTQNPTNLISTAGTPIMAAQLMLGPLGLNGLDQVVHTLLPLPGSPAIQSGDPTQLPPGLFIDERQLPRTINSKLDLGAVQTNYTAIQFVQQPSNARANANITPAVTMSVTESGTTAVNVPLPITFTGTGALHGTLTESTVASTIAGNPALASFANLSGDTAGTGDTLVSTVIVTPAGVTPAQTLTATSTPFDILVLLPSTVQATVNPTTPIYGQPVTVTVTVPTVGGIPPTGTVTIYYNGQPIGTGTLGPGGTVIITIPGGILPVGTDTITVGYGGDGNYGGSTGAPISVRVIAPTPPPVDFAIKDSTPPQTILPGQSATYTLSLSPINGVFSNAITLSASGLPSGATATFKPASVTPGSAAAATTMTIATTKQTAMLQELRPAAPLMLGLLLPLFGLRRARRKLQRYCMLLLFAVLSIGAVTGLSGCSPGGFFGQAPQTYTVTVTGTSGSLQHSTTVTLTVQ
jgi:trimeric autotransporter adhesin